MLELKKADIDVYNAIKGEEQREKEKIVLIASETRSWRPRVRSSRISTPKAIPTAGTTAGVSTPMPWRRSPSSGRRGSSAQNM
jgi:hypothetical protein